MSTTYPKQLQHEKTSKAHEQNNQIPYSYPIFCHT